jgi:hypothetical protein
MNLKRAVILGAPCGAVAVWLAAAATSGPRPAARTPAYTATPVEARGAELAAEIARLHERLRPTATPLQTRDLFRYGGRKAAAPVTSRASTSPPAHESVAPRVAPPAFALVGMAEDAGPDGPIRTAIISGGGHLFLVKEGEAVTSRYRVAKISPEVVELGDVSDGTALRLVLR